MHIVTHTRHWLKPRKHPTEAREAERITASLEKKYIKEFARPPGQARVRVDSCCCFMHRTTLAQAAPFPSTLFMGEGGLLLANTEQEALGDANKVSWPLFGKAIVKRPFAFVIVCHLGEPPSRRSPQQKK